MCVPEKGVKNREANMGQARSAEKKRGDHLHANFMHHDTVQ